MKRTIFPTRGETPIHRLDPLVRQQLKIKPHYGNYYEDYDPDPEDIDVISARRNAAYGKDVTQSDVEIKSFNIPCGTHYIPARRYKAHKYCPNVVLYLHGGSFILGSTAHKDAQCRYLAETSKACVISIDYRLAPENPYPAAVVDALAALNYCSEMPHEKLIIVGDSAGGTLAANALLASPVIVDYAVFIYAALDLASPGQMLDPWSYSLYECDEEERDLIYNRLNRFRLLTKDVQKLYLQNGESPLDPAISPCRATDFSRFPNSLFVIAEYDYYRFCNEAFARRLEWRGIEPEVLYYEGLDHGFFDRLGVLPQAKECIEQIGFRIQHL